METRVSYRRGSVVGVEAEGYGPYFVSLAAFRPEYAIGQLVTVEGPYIAPVTGDFIPCLAPDCEEEGEYDCDHCSGSFCGYHMNHPGPDLCDGCNAIASRRGRAW